MTILKLVHERDDGEADTYHLKPLRRYHIGRGSACEIRILDMKMSRQHCALEFIDEHWELLDLGSTNGVALDGERVRDRAVIDYRHEIAAGNSVLQVEALGRDPKPPASAAAGGSGSDELGRHDSDLIPDTSAIPQTAALEAGQRGGSQSGLDAIPAEDDEADVRVKTDTTGPMSLRWEDRQEEVALTPIAGSPVLPPGAEPIDADDDSVPAAEPVEPAASGDADAGPTDADPVQDPEPPTGPTVTAPAIPEAQAAPVSTDEDVPTPAELEPSAEAAATAPTTAEPASEEFTPTAAPEAEPRQTASGRIRPITIRVGKAGNAGEESSGTDSGAHRRSLEDTDDRLLYINVLGRRIGPVTRSQARELKARELKGELSEADLTDFIT